MPFSFLVRQLLVQVTKDAPGKTVIVIGQQCAGVDFIHPVKICHHREPPAHIIEMQLLCHYGELALWEF